MEQIKESRQDACVTNGMAKGSIYLVGQASSLSPVKQFRMYRRNLPHWEQPGSAYFITFRTSKDFILPNEARNLVLNSIKFHNNKKYKLYACVIMPDHVHLILQPLEKTKDAYYTIAEIMHSIKSYTANQINKQLDRKGSVWLDESFDRIIRDEKELLEKMNYISNNPVKSNLVQKIEDYKWIYLTGYSPDEKETRETGKDVCPTMSVPPEI